MSPATEPRRSRRLRCKPPEPGTDADLERGASPGKRQGKSAGCAAKESQGAVNPAVGVAAEEPEEEMQMGQDAEEQGEGGEGSGETLDASKMVKRPSAKGRGDASKERGGRVHGVPPRHHGNSNPRHRGHGGDAYYSIARASRRGDAGHLQGGGVGGFHAPLRVCPAPLPPPIPFVGVASTPLLQERLCVSNQFRGLLVEDAPAATPGVPATPVNTAPAAGYHFGAPGYSVHPEPLLADLARAAGYAAQKRFNLCWGQSLVHPGHDSPNIPSLNRTMKRGFQHHANNRALELESPRMLRYENMVQVKNIYLMARDQNGYQFLQQKFEEGKHHVDVVFEGIIDHIAELMTDKFANYLIQRLLDVCDEDQRLRIIAVLTEDPVKLLRISLNTHGRRAIQKLIETVKTKKQIALIISALQPGFVHLVNDLNGNHVIQKCLSNFGAEEKKGAKTQLFVKICGHLTISIHENLNEYTVRQLIELAFAKGGFQLFDYYSTLPGKLLEPEELVSYYNITNGSTITVSNRQRGGRMFQLIDMQNWNETIDDAPRFEVVQLPQGLIDIAMNITEANFLSPHLQHHSKESLSELTNKHFTGVCYGGQFTPEQILFENGKARFASTVKPLDYEDSLARLDLLQLYNIFLPAFWGGDDIQYPLHVTELLNFLRNPPANASLNGRGVNAYLSNPMAFLPHMQKIAVIKILRILIEGLDMVDYASLPMISNNGGFHPWPNMIWFVPEMNNIYMYNANTDVHGRRIPTYTWRPSEFVRHSSNYYKHANHVQFSPKQLEAALSLATDNYSFLPALLRELAIRVDGPLALNTPGVQRFLDGVVELLGNRTTLGM